jgi:hypothetical protein
VRAKVIAGRYRSTISRDADQAITALVDVDVAINIQCLPSSNRDLLPHGYRVLVNNCAMCEVSPDSQVKRRTRNETAVALFVT